MLGILNFGILEFSLGILEFPRNFILGILDFRILDFSLLVLLERHQRLIVSQVQQGGGLLPSQFSKIS